MNHESLVFGEDKGEAAHSMPKAILQDLKETDAISAPPAAKTAYEAALARFNLTPESDKPEAFDEIPKEKDDLAELEAAAGKAETFDDLNKIIEGGKGVQGSEHYFSAEELQERIKQVREGGPIELITRSGNLRQRVYELLKDEEKNKKMEEVRTGLQELGGSGTESAESFEDKAEELLAKIDSEVNRVHAVGITNRVQSRDGDYQGEDFVNELQLPVGDPRRSPALKEIDRLQTELVALLSANPEEAKKFLAAHGGSADMGWYNTTTVKAIEAAVGMPGSVASPETVSVVSVTAETPNGQESAGISQEKEKFLVDQVITQYLSYADADLPPEAKEKNKEWGLKSESARKYATAILEIAKKGSLQSVEQLAENLKQQCEKILNKAHISSGPYTKSKTWAMWDIGKQKYFSEHEEEADDKYTKEDPMTSEDKQREIVDRHVGWETYGQRASLEDFLKSVPDSDAKKNLAALLQREPKAENGTLSSRELAEIGNLIRGLEQKENGSRNEKPRSTRAREAIPPAPSTEVRRNERSRAEEIEQLGMDARSVTDAFAEVQRAAVRTGELLGRFPFGAGVVLGTLESELPKIKAGKLESFDLMQEAISGVLRKLVEDNDRPRKMIPSEEGIGVFRNLAVTFEKLREQNKKLLYLTRNASSKDLAERNLAVMNTERQIDNAIDFTRKYISSVRRYYDGN